MSAGLNESQEKFIAIFGGIISIVIPFFYGFMYLNDINLGIALAVFGFILFITLPLSYIPYLGFIVYISINYIFIVPGVFAMTELEWSQTTIIMFVIYSVTSMILTYYMVAGKNKYEGYM